MSRTVWRIATDTPDFTADDLNGAGAKRTGGRWNRKGSPLVYCSSSIALACLETLVHLDAGGLPLNRYLVEISIPDALWKHAAHFDGADPASIGWDACPAGRISMDAGDLWLAAKSSTLMLVPSAVVPEEKNILIDPAHPGARGISARKLRRWLYDPRMRV